MTKTKYYVPAKIIKSGDGLRLDIIDRPVRIKRDKIRSLTMDDVETQSTITRKTFVTTCHFEPKQVPVRYSETMILNIATKKKTYFESIYNEVKLYPYRWEETMIVELQNDSKIKKAETVFCLEYEDTNVE